MTQEYPIETPEQDINPDTGEIMEQVQHNLFGHVESMIIEDNHLVINDEYMTTITPSIMKQLAWNPKEQPFIKGTYEGSFTYTWDNEKSSGSYMVNIVRMGEPDYPVDCLLPDWSAITNKFAEMDPGTEVAIIYNGLITLKNGHPYHDVTIARKK